MVTLEAVRRATDDLCHMEQWSFWFDDRHCVLVLDQYARLERPTIRHKWRVTARYIRLMRQKSSLTLDETPFPDDVAQEALAGFVARLRVVRS